MSPDDLRSWCLQLPGAKETFPFTPEVSVFKVERKGKIFALSALAKAPLDVSVKCDPELGESLRSSYEAVIPGYHLNKRHWITITVGGDLEDERIRDLIVDSYDLVRPKRGRGQPDAPPDAQPCARENHQACPEQDSNLRPTP